MKPCILVVDDEAGVRSALSGVLRDEGYEVETVASGEACEAVLWPEDLQHGFWLGNALRGLIAVCLESPTP